MRDFVRDQGLREILPQAYWWYSEDKISSITQITPKIAISGLFFTVSKILCKIRQSHQDNAQAGHIDDIGIGVKHAGKDNGETRTQNGPDDKNMKLGQDITSFQADS